ncbi:uncharacterized protein EI97DRAFT_440691 [Westerdykella ornata]|uniref:F-box domain-containing protein n=1 Tax=Westerdykella ornata TaxID=318751 RepID=A0A6A6JNI0_WESOR|nr:uncharacterized protein EI97DRAFT_440691 [Westerdykella ornata]KAF2278180.1 hypothetical protein EI97DRAFT_440691 [Westerdykella ornata]
MQAVLSVQESPCSRALSRLETLPPEIRYKIFDYVGYPVGSHVWVDWRSLLSNGDSEEDFEQRTRIISATEGNNPWKLLAVSKTIRSEVLSLLLGRVLVRFDYELSTRPVHYHNPDDDSDCDWDLHETGEQELETITYHRMWFPTSWFAALTIVHLSDSIGHGNAARRPGYPYNRRSYTHRVLRKQASTIRFIAKHCPALVKLQVDLFLRRRQNSVLAIGYPARDPKRRVLSRLLRAFLKVVRNRPEFEKLVIPGQKPSEERQTLWLKDMPMEMREDKAKVWVKDVIRRLAALPNMYIS